MSDADHDGKKAIAFSFQDERAENLPGYHRLDIHMTRGEEEFQFEVTKVELWVISHAGIGEANQAIELALTPGWVTPRQYRIVPGTVILTTTHLDDHEVFTFGGSMDVRGDETITDCVLRSSAPIFQRSEEENPREVFIEEVEAMIAQEHAKWGRDDQGFRNRLSEVPPAKLYTSCLISILERINRKGLDGSSQFTALKKFVQRELRAVEDREVPPLSGLL